MTPSLTARMAICWSLFFLLTSWIGDTHAHEMSIAEMSVREVATNDYVWNWGVPGRDKPISQDLSVKWPEGCRAEGAMVHCGPKGLAGTLSIEGLGTSYSAALIRLTRIGDTQGQAYTLTSSKSTARIMPPGDDLRPPWEIGVTYTELGIEHILSGIDHLLFVLSLLIMVGYTRKLIWTITAFTLAHSLTLAASALGWLTLHSAPVEATIALSIVLVCVEALHKQDTFTRRWPAAVAFIFGLIHGLGFAGALQEIGLPQNSVFVSLLGFNVGVELGQFFVLGLAWLAYRVVVNSPAAAKLRHASLYGIGTIAAYWSMTRIVALIAA